jgi:hypothetical protein
MNDINYDKNTKMEQVVKLIAKYVIAKHKLDSMKQLNTDNNRQTMRGIDEVKLDQYLTELDLLLN